MKNQPFRFWCQKVLPLVYDDSLSYYELLCKVVAKLNEVIETDNSWQTEISALENSLNELKTYVDTYFTNLDIQTEINNKLDMMANDGTLESLLNESLLTIINNTKTNFCV